MIKEEFLEILFRQQRSGLMIKNFCVNEAYTESSFFLKMYWSRIGHRSMSFRDLLGSYRNPEGIKF